MSEINITSRALNLILDTMENQILLLRNFDATALLSPIHNMATDNSYQSELKSFQIENIKLLGQIQKGIMENLSKNESKCDCSREYQKGFDEGLKAAQREMIVSNMIPDDFKMDVCKKNVVEQDVVTSVAAIAVSEAMLDEPVGHKVEEETVPDVEDDEERADVDTVNVPHEKKETEQETEQEAEQETEQETEQEQDESEDDELQEVEFNGKTYYYHEETGQIFLPSAEGEIDLESPVGCWSEKKGTFVLFRASSRT